MGKLVCGNCRNNPELEAIKLVMMSVYGVEMGVVIKDVGCSIEWWRKRKFECKRVAAGAHLPIPWLF